MDFWSRSDCRRTILSSRVALYGESESQFSINYGNVPEGDANPSTYSYHRRRAFKSIYYGNYRQLVGDCRRQSISLHRRDIRSRKSSSHRNFSLRHHATRRSCRVLPVIQKQDNGKSCLVSRLRCVSSVPLVILRIVLFLIKIKMDCF